MDADSKLNDLLQAYRVACPDVEPGANFMPSLWRRIETRPGFWFAFQSFARTGVAACGVLCLLLVVLDFVSPAQNRLATPSYTDALLAEHNAENVYYTEAIRVEPSPGLDR